MPDNAKVRPVAQYSDLGPAMKKRWETYRTTDTVEELLAKGIDRKTIVRDLDSGHVKIEYRG